MRSISAPRSSLFHAVARQHPSRILAGLSGIIILRRYNHHVYPFPGIKAGTLGPNKHIIRVCQCYASSLVAWPVPLLRKVKIYHTNKTGGVTRASLYVDSLRRMNNFAKPLYLQNHSAIFIILLTSMLLQQMPTFRAHFLQEPTRVSQNFRGML